MSWFAPLYDGVLARSERTFLAGWRATLVGDLSGRVLEIGAGTGANLPYYPPEVDELVLTEPSEPMRAQLVQKLALARVRSVRVDPSPAESLAAPDRSVDAVVGTLVLCSVADPARALAEIARVLRPGGTFRFVEHVGGHGWRRAAQRVLEPGWACVAGNCRLTRPTLDHVRAAGFVVDRVTVEEPPTVPAFLRPWIRGSATAP
ncbi:MAG: methyltransferase domain-containing protein [Myxococcota bacterium]